MRLELRRGRRLALGIALGLAAAGAADAETLDLVCRPLPTERLDAVSVSIDLGAATARVSAVGGAAQPPQPAQIDARQVTWSADVPGGTRSYGLDRRGQTLNMVTTEDGGKTASWVCNPAR